ncbi:MAG TPA: endonuclease/exonuclease/phosphatase family protein [Kofleriaceae bacterium]|nr:endonuclease/exonuclease/phosphatase family protein [Kofleriaceae bacterium]
MGARLRIMTYNIRNGRGLDERVDLGRIAGVIASFDPDIVALQEVDAHRSRSGTIDQTHALAERLGMNATFGPCIDHGNERYGIATLARLPILTSRQLCLPAQAHRRRSEPRCALVTRLAWHEAASELEMVNTHLSVLPGERPAQVAAIAETLDADEVIVAGDFNCTPRSRAFRTLACGLRSVVARSARSWPTRLPLFALDHILYRGPLTVVHAGTWRGGAANRASDHLPVVAELERV